jgi:integrase
MPKQRTDDIADRIRARVRGGPPRYYADFRDYEDVGGAQEALRAAGSAAATSDFAEACLLAAARLEQLEHLRNQLPRVAAGERTFDGLVPIHLTQKSKVMTAGWIGTTQGYLERAAAFFGPNHDLGLITPADVTDYRSYLMGLPNGRGGTLSNGSVNKHLFALSNLFLRARERRLLQNNPVADVMEKLPDNSVPTPWLEADEMVEILRYAFETYGRGTGYRAIPHFPFVAGYALLGLREAELTGLRCCEVNLTTGMVDVRPNHWRRLKTKKSQRVLRIPKQLLELWREYAASEAAPTGDLFFPSACLRAGREIMITDLRKALDKMPMPERLRRRMTDVEIERERERRRKLIVRWTPGRTGPKPKETVEELQAPFEPTLIPPLRTKMLRHTWCAARLQNVDRGQPISPWTVAQEMGHVNTDMVNMIYGHYANVVHRGEEVAFRW